MWVSSVFGFYSVATIRLSEARQCFPWVSTSGSHSHWDAGLKIHERPHWNNKKLDFSSNLLTNIGKKKYVCPFVHLFWKASHSTANVMHMINHLFSVCLLFGFIMERVLKDSVWECSEYCTDFHEMSLSLTWDLSNGKQLPLLSFSFSVPPLIHFNYFSQKDTNSTQSERHSTSGSQQWGMNCFWFIGLIVSGTQLAVDTASS